MTAKIIDGKNFAASILKKVASHVADLKTNHNLIPGLAVILVGHDPASEVYVHNKGKQAEKSGINSFKHHLDSNTRQEDLLALIEQLNADPDVHGILCQLPLPKHLNSEIVINTIAPAKDVDGFHISNIGLLATGQKSMIPCTPLGCLMLLQHHLGDLKGLNAFVVGRSNIVGKPMSQLLLNANCTVTVGHRHTLNLADEVKRADIVVAAVGKTEFIQGEWLKPGATVIDVGINRVKTEDNKTRLLGDVHFESAEKVAGAITPVPGGVGPMTIACLLANTVTACCRSAGLPDPEELTVS